MNPTGRLQIELSRRAGAVVDVRITSSRPSELTRVLQGQTATQLLHAIPLLFTLCANAHTHAALRACCSATSCTDTIAADAARQILVQAETLREHVWRMLLDWPKLMGATPDKSALASLLRFDGLLKRGLFRDGAAYKPGSPVQPCPQLPVQLAELMAIVDLAVFAGGLAEFQRLEDEADFKAWLARRRSPAADFLVDVYARNWMGLGGNAIACLPELDPIALDTAMRQDKSAFCRLPHWQNRCHATTPLNRQRLHPLVADLQARYGNGLLAHFAARLTELAGLPAAMWRLASRLNDSDPLPPDATPENGVALIQLQAARGLLIHRLELKDGRVYDYRIVAPTEWNFHPHGVAAEGLRTLQGDDADLRRQAAFWIAAIDPCVSYELTLGD